MRRSWGNPAEQPGSAPAPATPAPRPVERDRRPRPLWFCLWLHGEEPAGRVLGRVARRATRFTPTVSLPRTDPAVLLEVGASLRLFGGAGQLGERLRALSTAGGAWPLVSAAPTARAALWLARAGRPVLASEPAQLPGLLGSLPVAVTGWPAAAQQLLAGCGADTLGHCLRLPRHGLARRIGPGLLHELDQALGRQPYQPPPWTPPRPFRAIVGLPLVTGDGTLLFKAACHLLEQLGAELGRRQAAAAALHWRFGAPADGNPPLRIGLARPSASPGLLHELVRLRFAALALASPVDLLELVVHPVALPGQAGTDLLGDFLDLPGEAAGFLGRLRARLGADAVHGLGCQAAWRPEAAWSRQAGGQCHAPGARQPVWLLPVPRRLREAGGRPEWSGPLELESGPQRIETGWWDGEPVRRDYYAARNPQGAGVWVFRDLRDAGWYLHGLFG
jgi:protein ImuB